MIKIIVIFINFIFQLITKMSEIKDDQYLPIYNKNNNFVPILKPDDVMNQRLEKISSYYEMEYKKKPHFFVRVPGR